NDRSRRLHRRSFEASVGMVVRNLRHTLALSQDLNQQLGGVGPDGTLSASRVSVARNLSDMHVSGLSVLVRMMEQLMDAENGAGAGAGAGAGRAAARQGGTTAGGEIAS
ncbi:hypothetical protein HK405_013618, partial [Cladochytrium tenue]